MKKKKLRKELTEALRRANPDRRKKWAVRESKRMVREATADAKAAVRQPAAEDLTALPPEQLAAWIFRVL